MQIYELYNEVLAYLLKIPTGNKSAAYTPSGSLVNGATLKSWTTKIQYCPSATMGSITAYSNVTQVVKTSEDIPAAYKTQATDARITSDWTAFKNAYMSKMFNSENTLSLSSIFVFIYLVRCFIDARFTLFTDVYHTSYVWLYNTSSSVDYRVNSNISVAKFTNNYGKTNAVSNLNTIINALAAEISDRRSFYILKSTASATTTDL
jgi:hypothetical protein